MSESAHEAGISMSNADSAVEVGNPEQPSNPVSTEGEATREDAYNPKMKRRIKVDGEEREVTLEEMERDYQLKQASHKRLQEAAAKEKAIQEREKAISQIEKALEDGNLGFIERKLGKEKAKQLMEEYLIADMEYQELPESEKRARELEAKLKKYEQREKEEQEKQEKAKKAEILQAAHEDIDKEVGDALKSIGRKPTPKLAARVVDEMIYRLTAEKNPISANDAVKYAEEGILEDIKEFLPQMSIDELLQTIPPEVVTKIRQHEVEKVMGDRSNRRVTVDGAGKVRPQTKKLSIDDWFKDRQKRFG